MRQHGCSGCMNPQIFGTSPFAPADFEAFSTHHSNIIFLFATSCKSPIKYNATSLHIYQTCIQNSGGKSCKPVLQPLNFDCQGQVICVQCVFALSTRSTECKYHLLFWDEFNNARLGRARHIYQLTQYQAKENQLVEFFDSDLEFVKE